MTTFQEQINLSCIIEDYRKLIEFHDNNSIDFVNFIYALLEDLTFSPTLLPQNSGLITYELDATLSDYIQWNHYFNDSISIVKSIDFTKLDASQIQTQKIYSLLKNIEGKKFLSTIDHLYFLCEGFHFSDDHLYGGMDIFRDTEYEFYHNCLFLLKKIYFYTESKEKEISEIFNSIACINVKR